MRISWNRISDWLPIVFHFSTENWEEQLKKSPCINILLTVETGFQTQSQLKEPNIVVRQFFVILCTVLPRTPTKREKTLFKRG